MDNVVRLCDYGRRELRDDAAKPRDVSGQVFEFPIRPFRSASENAPRHTDAGGLTPTG
jgi:hypothetical protein